MTMDQPGTDSRFTLSLPENPFGVGALGGIIAGGALGTIFGPVGTVAGALFGLVVGDEYEQRMVKEETPRKQPKEASKPDQNDSETLSGKGNTTTELENGSFDSMNLDSNWEDLAHYYSVDFEKEENETELTDIVSNTIGFPYFYSLKYSQDESFPWPIITASKRQEGDLDKWYFCFPENETTQSFFHSESPNRAYTTARTKKIDEIPGIGEKKAKKLQEAGYETIADIITADKDELAKISGIGKELALRIKSYADDFLESINRNRDQKST